MSRNMRILGALLALGFVLPGSTLSQEPAPLEYPVKQIRAGIELGVDIVGSYNWKSPEDLKQVAVPFGSASSVNSPQAGLRAAFYTSPTIAIEPVTSFSWVDDGNGSSFAWSLAGKMQVHFDEAVTKKRKYWAVGGTFTLVDDVESETQFGVTTEVGLKIPWEDYLGGRIAIGYTHLFESGILVKQDIIFVSAGFSVSWWR